MEMLDVFWVRVFWIVVLLAIAGAFAKRIVGARGRRSTTDLGSVSHQWIAEHRLSSTSER